MNFLALIFKKKFQKKAFFYISGNGTLCFLPQAPKIKEIYPDKISDTSGNKNPKKCFIFSQKKTVSYVSEKGNSEKIVYIFGANLQSQKIKNVYIFPYKEAKFFKLKFVFF